MVYGYLSKSCPLLGRDTGCRGEVGWGFRPPYKVVELAIRAQPRSEDLRLCATAGPHLPFALDDLFLILIDLGLETQDLGLCFGKLGLLALELGLLASALRREPADHGIEPAH